MAAGPNLVLTGFMGTGKSTVGPMLADRLGMDFVDTDQVIEDRYGPIEEIFREQGEPAFREMERIVATEMGKGSGMVIATGGHMVLDAENRRALEFNGKIFCLVASADEIRRRISTASGRYRRPLLDGEDTRLRVIELLEARQPGYSEFSQVITDGLRPDQVVAEVTRLWLEKTALDSG